MANNSFKPKLLRSGNGVAKKACHAATCATQFGLTQALGSRGKFMDLLGEVLTRVKNGECTFKPADDSLTALRDFQGIVQALHAASEKKLIASLTVPPASKGRDTYGLTKVALVSGGLTYHGEQYLASPPAQSTSTRAWVMTHLTQIVVGVVSTIIAAILVMLWGIE